VSVTTAATVPFCLIGAHTSIPYLVGAMIVRGAGMGCAFMPIMTAAYAALERRELSDATPQLNILNRVGGSVGVALLAVILQRSLDHAHSLGAAASSYGLAFWGAMALTAIAIIPCVILTRAEHTARHNAAEHGRLQRAAPAEAAA
ncbi:MAG: MFS transporter, partial [Solirubrobacteraceae bacterium]